MNTPEHVHFIGIGGYGMSAIAKVMLEMGYQVSGSDLAQQELTEKLRAKGARVYIGHEAQNVNGADLVVYSTALSKDNVEMVAAGEQNIPVIHRSQMLARLMNERKGIAVAGAHGKTTTSSMIALVMEHCGTDPTYIIGGEIMNIGSNAKAGKGDYVVAEADESDGTFLQYHPTLALVNNIEADHLENYDGDFENLKKAYAQFLSQVREDGKAIICLDDEYLRGMLPQIKSETLTYAIDRDADYVATDIELGDRKVSFSVRRGGETLGKLRLSVPGRHNVYNAMATLITCLEAGLTFDQIAEAIHEFRGAKRRFQVLGEVNDILVIDDYAHHPTEIEATISAAKATGKHLIAVFQPQRYTRTFYLFEQFSHAFKEADEVLITDIYSPAGEKQIEGISSEKLVELIRKNSNPNVTYIPTRGEAEVYLTDRVKPGDLVITMGAGDIWKTADGLAKTLRARYEAE
ncbi:UDP-N-acetylmuramate--L-alanine ligase [Paenibacillus chitinolyticus]|uniref:UDP-N-acetylmuramate--L-alanine ligase n=1 Tax=Paenibacillus chitinolyticus TaxID=79263 RepID=A0A410X226_9BACL|nr:UDP-N-acetylmuramate--L-alanine ligase [Paenibacillus chitinolyticus]MCY9593488.1 UDP-N-acetylmuramate--L-alanine ligase [Paenibacillus chitinolyticus]MCY9597459.1 UDP-N-acetylmuramate--L-alanine ligase [Paenibacillus chitinolyticus]QAV20664.1 UDP-N-acetylmuramate--L-alanine ligase [Paenibacillus chitinolyticus]GKS10414.1 UDP-N-acetylmuramate--L-alanine ligase [Paenibacillus chitinolyticus]